MSSTQNVSFKANPLLGYVLIAGATFFWAVSANLGRAVFTGRLLPNALRMRSVDPIILSQTRTTFAFLIFFIALLHSRGWKKLQIPIPDIGRIFMVGIFGLVGSNYLYYLALQRTNVATAIIVQYTAPIWVLLYMAARGKQKIAWPQILAVALAVSGIVLVVGLFGAGRFDQDKLGLLAALLAAFAFAFYNISGHSIVKRYDSWIVLLYLMFSASIFWMVVNPPWKILAAHYSAAEWLFMFIFSLVSMMISYPLYVAGLRHLDPTRAVVVSCLEPVFSIVIAALVLGEIVRPLQGAGVALVLMAIVVVQLPDGKTKEAMPGEPIEQQDASVSDSIS